MKIQVQFDCPIGVVVDTETGDVERVIVWDESLDTTGEPTGISRDEYVKQGHPDFERVIAGRTEEMQDFGRSYGASLFEPMPSDHEEAVKALAIVRDSDIEWPAWEFGA
jgi:hypothetical protein